MHGFANPKRFLALAGWLTPVLLVGGVVLTAAALAWGFTQVPPDRLGLHLLGDFIVSVCELYPEHRGGQGYAQDA